MRRCSHATPRPSFAGVKVDGTWASTLTAEYPSTLATAIAKVGNIRFAAQTLRRLPCRCQETMPRRAASCHISTRCRHQLHSRSTGELLWDTQRDARRDPLAGCSARILGGIHWRAALRDTWRDPLASSSGGILGGIHWPAALAGYSAGSTGQQLWRDTWRDQLASCSGGILGGIHWRAALAGYWVGVWCRSIANTDSNIKSNNPFLSGGENTTLKQMEANVFSAPTNRKREFNTIGGRLFFCFFFGGGGSEVANRFVWSGCFPIERPPQGSPQLVQGVSQLKCRNSGSEAQTSLDLWFLSASLA